MDSRTNLRIVAVFLIALFCVLGSLITTYLYGFTFSHPRYWEGTIARVLKTEADLIEALISNTRQELNRDLKADQFEAMFGPLKDKVIIEAFEDGVLIWTNSNGKYGRGELISRFPSSDRQSIVLSRYKPPEWNTQFSKWLTTPQRWFEPSLDHITFPFVWFLSIYGLAAIAVVLAVRVSYLERDVLFVFQDIEKKFNQR